MTWECGECRQKETNLMKINTLCHHCRKPVCHKHRFGVLDDTFANFEGVIGNIAFHCSSCKRTYHPNATVEQIIIKK